MATLARKGVEVDGERRGESLAFARAHFGDLTVVEHHAADQLHVVVAHAEHANRGFAHHGERFGQELIRRFALGDAFAEFSGLGLQFLVRERLHGGFELVDRFALAAILLDQAVVAAAEDFGKEFVKHGFYGSERPLVPSSSRRGEVLRAGRTRSAHCLRWVGRRPSGTLAHPGKAPAARYALVPAPAGAEGNLSIIA